MTTQLMRNRYVNDAVTTASPARLVTMLYDRLVLDLINAEAALAGDDGQARSEAGLHLLHAQDIVFELLAGLDQTAWSGGPGLAAVYQFLISELVAANVNSDAGRVASCRGLVEPLQEAWHQAAQQVLGGGPASSTSSSVSA